MEPLRWQQVKEILGEASALPLRDQESFVRQACGSDDALQEEVSSLLSFDDETLDVLVRPVFDVNAKDPALGRRIGHYRIDRPLGRGGMGSVYLATREDDYSQQVAIKLIQSGLGTDDLIGRFHEERQILADLDHPAIARLVDGGTTDNGHPYLVMERVDGEPIDDYCDRHQLDIHQRLELFRRVLAAVHFSHQHLVVHRDLKPANILVTTDGAPKLIDFGIAKLLQPTEDATPPTAPRSRGPLSPHYASPEQIQGERVTTASDTYALGVLLYQLLVGRHPYPIATLERDELLEAICEIDPPAPSAKVVRSNFDSKVAQARRTTPPRLRQQLAGELDAIVLKAMHKHPADRYDSVDRLSEDIGRLLEGFPVRAQPSSVGYRARKFIGRHRRALAAAALAMAVLGFFLTTLVLRARLEHQLVRTNAISTFVNAVFREANPDRADGDELVAEEILRRASLRVGRSLKTFPKVRIEINAVLGRVNHERGRLTEAQQLLTEALRLQREHDPGNDSAVARLLNDLAAVLHDLGDSEAAEQLYREALEAIGGCRSPTADAPIIANNLAVLLSEQGNYAEAAKLGTCVREERERRLPPDHPDIASSFNFEALQNYNQGDVKGAVDLIRQALAIRRRVFGLGHTKVANTLNNLGGILLADQRHREAKEALDEALEIRKHLLGNDHPKVANTEKNLARALTALGDATAAEPLARHAVEVLRAGPGDWRLADAESVLGECLIALGRYHEAEPLVVDSLPIIELSKGPESPYTTAAHQRIAKLRSAQQ